MTNPATLTSVKACQAEIDTVQAKYDEIDKKSTAVRNTLGKVMIGGLAVGAVCIIASGGVPLLQAAGYLPQISAAMLEVVEAVMTVISGTFVAFLTYMLWTGSNYSNQAIECYNALNPLRDRKHELQDEFSSRWLKYSVGTLLLVGATSATVYVARNYLAA